MRKKHHGTITLLVLIALFAVYSGCAKKSSPASPGMPEDTSTFTCTGTPQGSPTDTPTAGQTATMTFTATQTHFGSATPTVTATETGTLEDTATVTETLTHSRTATHTYTGTETATMTLTCTGSPTQTHIMTATDTMTATQTNTPTVSPTAYFGTINGALALPAGQPGVAFQVIVDTDLSFANGFANSLGGLLPADISVPYSITAPAGTFYVYAVVKTVSPVDTPPRIGDYLGVYGTTYPVFPASPNMSIAAGSSYNGINLAMVQAAANVHGTMTMPSDVNGKQVMIVLDDDGNPFNGAVTVLDIQTISGMTGYTWDYATLCPLPGTYYIYALVDVGGYGLPGIPHTGDYVTLTPGGSFTLDPAIDNGPYNLTLSTY